MCLLYGCFRYKPLQFFTNRQKAQFSVQITWLVGFLPAEPRQGIEFSPGRCEVWVRPAGQSCRLWGGKGSTTRDLFPVPYDAVWKQDQRTIFFELGPKSMNEKTWWLLNDQSVEETHIDFSWIFDWSFPRRHPSISSSIWLCLLPFRGSQWPGKLIGSVYLVFEERQLWNCETINMYWWWCGWWWWWWWWWWWCRCRCT